MPKTAELTGAMLDYWTGKADKKPVRMHEGECVECLPLNGREIAKWTGYAPSTDWAQCGPLIEKWSIELDQPGWRAKAWRGGYWSEGVGTTPQEAICRAVVRAAFGDEVPEVAP